ncbi:efflux RND transporter periplasmic adaptor subunit [Marinisporobacter balticus]|uniref:RND family efflux transporter MFP subunit n=1 Tax=Marinisporobacter balticus TaxID=2018667 RepID=A0A4R2LC49_9FIRM|nr:efflux RND transporter periplasmic adaptor subunit [Marinisporobacter balticus]TCO76895.1 RND family efflux transporter MFP subunit [Marinisporobacter balticus]
MKKRLCILVGILLINSFLFVGCGKSETKEADGKDVSIQKEEVIYVKTEPVISMDFTNTLLLPGNLKPKEEAIVTAEVNGKVNQIYTDLGRKVSQGESLCKLEDTTYLLTYENKKKDLSIGSIEFKNLTKDYERTKSLYENNVESKSEFDTIEKNYEKQKEELVIKENDVALAKKNLDDTLIKAPISGIISNKKVLIGQTVSSGIELFKLVNIDQIYVEVGVSEKDMPFIKNGQVCSVNVDMFSNSFKGKITNIGPEPSSETKTYPVKILIKNEKGNLKSGMFANVEIILDKHKDGLAVPKKSVIKEQDRYYVFVKEDKKAVKKYVKIGFSSDAYNEILEGVEKGEQIIMVGNEDLEDGSLVEEKE